MRIKDIDGETIAKLITRYEREIVEMKPRSVLVLTACRYFASS